MSNTCDTRWRNLQKKLRKFIVSNFDANSYSFFSYKLALHTTSCVLLGARNLYKKSFRTF